MAKRDANQLTVTGNLGGDPEMRFTPSGKNVTTFSVACNDSYTNNAGETVQETVWVRAECWGRLAEVCNEYLKKGRQVLVMGRLKPQRSYTREDGTKDKSGYEMRASEVHFIGSNGAQVAVEEEVGEQIQF
jgi:single-strand DNA-binding protein